MPPNILKLSAVFRLKLRFQHTRTFTEIQPASHCKNRYKLHQSGRLLERHVVTQFQILQYGKNTDDMPALCQYFRISFCRFATQDCEYLQSIIQDSIWLVLVKEAQLSLFLHRRTNCACQSLAATSPLCYKQLGKGWCVTSKHNCLLSYLLCWRRHVRATVGHLQFIKMYE